MIFIIIQIELANFFFGGGGGGGGAPGAPVLNPPLDKTYTCNPFDIY